MRRISRFAGLAACCLLAVTSVAKADLAQDFFNDLIQNGDANVGDTIRLVFITSASINADDANTFATYNTFGDTAAGTGIVTSAFGLGADQWNPLVLTADGSADAITSVLGSSSSKVFNTQGSVVGNNGTAMLSGLTNPIVFDESGDSQLNQNSVMVWTGANAAGTPYFDAGPDPDIDGRLGSQIEVGGTTRDGLTNVGNGGSTANWLDFQLSTQSSGGIPVFDPSQDREVILGATFVERPIYVMSGDITVVPEPGTVVMWLTCCGIGTLVYWRKRRSS